MNSDKDNNKNKKIPSENTQNENIVDNVAEPVSKISEDSETTETSSDDKISEDYERNGSIVGDILTKILSVGGEGLSKAKDLKMPGELLNYGKEQISVFRKEITGIAGKELNQFLRSINIGQEIAKILTYLTFEIKMQIRLVPSEKGGLKPNIKTQVEKVEAEKDDKQQ